ncbi:isoprenyl transferase [Desulfitispora alkaliphila]|uniref:isoprenyl transferase n=1 Tax=Desulfitispora alkaliphila TaxID=622674 RepID=UPI003D21DDDD
MLFWKSNGNNTPLKTAQDLNPNIPRHIAIIMDGNGRWAKKRGLPRTAGHRAGVKSLKSIVKLCSKLKVEVLTVYAFSTENWKRPQEEVEVLMNLLTEYISSELEALSENNVRVRTIGEIERLPLEAQKSIIKAKAKTTENTGMIFNIALNYGGRNEILKAVQEIAQDAIDQKLKVEEIEKEVLENYLYTKGLPDPDLLIRPSGEQRISNYLLWQLAYTEFWFTDTLWPDFDESELIKAIEAYQKRERRFGGLKI